MAKRRSRGTGSIVRSDAGIYQLFWTDANGKRHKKSLRTKNRKEAEQAAKGFEEAVNAKDREQVLLESARARRIIETSTLPLEDAWQAFLATKPTTGQSTLEKVYRPALARFIEWASVERPALSDFTQIDKTTATAYMEHVRERGVSASTYNDQRNALGFITAQLANRHGIEINHWRNTPRMKSGAQQKRLPLTRQQARELMDVFENPDAPMPYRDELRCLVGLCLYAGMRLGDAVHLRWSSVDDEAGCIRYVPGKTARTSGVEAVVPVLPPLRLYLDALPLREDAEEDAPGYILPAVATHYTRNPDYIKTHLLTLIHGITGKGAQDTKTQHVRARSQYGVHSLRHTFATEAARAGASPAYLSLMTGDTLQTLEKFYVKLTYRQRAVHGFETLPRLLEAEPATTDPERDQLHRLADELPLEAIRDLLQAVGKGTGAAGVYSKKV